MYDLKPKPIKDIHPQEITLDMVKSLRLRGLYRDADVLLRRRSVWLREQRGVDAVVMKNRKNLVRSRNEKARCMRLGLCFQCKALKEGDRSKVRLCLSCTEQKRLLDIAYRRRLRVAAGRVEASE